MFKFAVQLKKCMDMFKAECKNKKYKKYINNVSRRCAELCCVYNMFLDNEYR